MKKLPLTKKLFTLSVVSLFTLLFLTFFHPISAMTQDLGRHLLTGKIISKTHSVPKTNLFSYTHSAFPFINHHWLSEVVFFLLTQAVGLHGLLVLTTIIATAAFLLLFFYGYQERLTNRIALLFTSLLFLQILFERTDVRPEILSFLFLSLFIVILFKNQKQPTKLLYLLIPIELLWVNMHIYFFIGILVLCLFLLDKLVESRHNLFSRDVKRLGLATILSGVITLVNPNFIAGALYPLRVFQNYGYSIEENQNIFFLQSVTQNAIIPYFEAAAILLFLFLFLTIKKTKLIDWLLAITFTVFSAMAIRNFPLFVFAAFIPFTNAASEVTRLASRLLEKKRKFNHALLTNIALSVFLTIVIWQIILLFTDQKVGWNTVSGAESAANFYVKNDVKGPVFNNFDIGSYLEYRVYPGQKVFVDGRPEAYPASFFQNIYVPMQEDSTLFQKVSTVYDFNSIFFSHTDATPWATQFLKSIIQNPEWKLVYLDDTVVIFLKQTGRNELLIDTYQMDENNLRITNFHRDNTQSLYQLAHFFYEVDWSDKELEMYRDILRLNPNECNALYNSAAALKNQGSELSNVFLRRYETNCK